MEVEEYHAVVSYGFREKGRASEKKVGMNVDRAKKSVI